MSASSSGSAPSHHRLCHKVLAEPSLLQDFILSFLPLYGFHRSLRRSSYRRTNLQLHSDGWSAEAHRLHHHRCRRHRYASEICGHPLALAEAFSQAGILISSSWWYWPGSSLRTAEQATIEIALGPSSLASSLFVTTAR